MQNVKGSFVVIIGVIVAILGLVLPFYQVNEVEELGVKASESILISYHSAINIVGILWATLAVLTLIFAVRGKKWMTLVFGLLTSLGMFMSFMSKSTEISDWDGMADLVETGPGYYISVISALVILAAVIIYFATVQKNEE